MMYEKSSKILTVLVVVFLILFLIEWNNSDIRTYIHTEEETINIQNDVNSIEDNSNNETDFYYGDYDCISLEGSQMKSSSRARVIEEETLFRQRISSITLEDIEILCRIVQAEAGGEDMLGRQMVADVIINRTQSAKFPDTIRGVVFQISGDCYQFSPVSDGRYYQVTVTNSTKDAVQNALYGQDSTNGALYFVAAKKADPERLKWFQNRLSYITEHGGHRFYK